MSKLTDEWGFFTPMPEMIIKMWPTIGTNAVALFLYLRYRTHKNRGVAFPGYKKIREDTGWGFSRIKEAIAELEAAKLIKRKKGYGKHSVVADPMFLDSANGDYRVRDGSPALKLGFKNFDVSGAGLLPDFPDKWED